MGLRGRKEHDKLGNTYFITSTLLGFEKIFTINDKYCDILIDSLKHLIVEHTAGLIAYVIMPNHIHLIISLPEGESISDFMRDFKRHTSSKIREQLTGENKNSIIDKLTSLGGTGKFRLWMDRFDDLIVTTQKVLEIKINYIHNNPVKAGLVENMTDWKYSSARNYYLDGHSVIQIERII